LPIVSTKPCLISMRVFADVFPIAILTENGSV
jgi:hypothetical protein